VLGPCRPRQQCFGLPPSTEADATERTVLAAKAATPPRGGRGEGRQTAWLLDVISRPSRAAPAQAGTTRARSIRPGEGERGDEPPGARVKRDITGGSAPRATGGQRTRTGTTVPRGGGFPARGCARASKHALQRSVAQSRAQRSRRDVLAAYARQRSLSGGRGLGRGWYSRTASQGVRPGALDDKTTVRRTPSWTFTWAPRRKTRDGIDETSGSPDVLPKEGTSDRPLSRSLHGGRGTAVLART